MGDARVKRAITRKNAESLKWIFKQMKIFNGFFKTNL